MRRLAKEPFVFVGLALVVWVILVFVSPDSCLHTLNDRYDSGWFLTCGRAWASGLVPYVDFSDSKGPLLWAIYAIGYLLSPHDYGGVFWLTWMCYVFTYMLVYLTARLFVARRLWALAVSVLMTWAWFNPLFFNEIRAEDFCHLPIMCCLYVTCRVLYAGHTRSRRAAWAVGAAVMAVALIKFNIAAMALVFPAALLWHAARHGGTAATLRSLVGLLAGAGLVALPFMVILALQGCLDDCWREYVMNTFATTRQGKAHAGEGYLAGLWSSLRAMSRMAKLYFALCLLGTLLMARVVRRYRAFPFLALCAFGLVMSPLLRQAHHYLPCAFTFVFFLIAVARWPATHAAGKPIMALVVLTLATCGAVYMAWDQNFNGSQPRANYYTMDSESRREYEFIAGEISTLDKPRILYWWAADVGFGTQARALPACRYWATQFGATREMAQDQSRAIMERRPHFVIIHARNHDALDPMLTRYGYRCLTPPAAHPAYHLYTKSSTQN